MRRIVFFCCAIIFLLLFLRWSFFTHCRASDFLFIINPSLSSLCCSSIESEFLRSFEKKNSDSDAIAQVKKLFSIVQSVSIAYQPTGGVVNVSAYKPVYVVNNTSVLMENNDIVDLSLFAQSVLDDLPPVVASQDFLVHNSGCLLQLLRRLPPQWSQFYECECISEYCIRLKDKVNPQFVVVYSEDQVISAHMLDQCEAVKKDIIKQGMLDKNVSWVADIRFANYIVAYKA